MAILEWAQHGLANFSGWQIVLFTLVVTHITIVAVTVYLHRHSSHRSVDLHPALSHFFRFWLWLTTGMVTKEFTAIHRKHHAKCETEDDPHSPQVQGINEIFWRGVEAYRRAATPETLAQYGAGCPDDWVERHVYTGRTAWGIFIMLGIDVALFGAIGITVWAVQMMWIPVLATGVINGIGHYWGYRNFECPDAARNISPWGILIGGEELHNNHHTYPNSAKLSSRPFEFDIGWMWIRLFEMCGLAKARSTGPVVAKVPGKSSLDMDTAWAVLNDRFRVMSRYAESVVAPMVKAQRDKADGASKALLGRKARVALCRDESIITPRHKEQISQLIEKHADLKVVYEFRLNLQEVWAKRSGDADEMLQALRSWCTAAEESGVRVLSDFVADLKSYGMPNLQAAR